MNEPTTKVNLCAGIIDDESVRAALNKTSDFYPMSETTAEPLTKTFESTWALVELFGHQKIVGKVTETSIAGGAFLRVDIPEQQGKPAFTRFFGPGAIYSINPTTEKLAREMLLMYRNEPVSRFDLPQIEEKVRPSFTTASESSGPEDGDNDDDGEF